MSTFNLKTMDTMLRETIAEKNAEISKLRKSINRAIGELRGIGDDDSTDDILAQCDYALAILKEAINPKPNDA